MYRPEQPDETTEPCAICGEPAECEVWETPTCYPCVSGWHGFARAAETPTTTEGYRELVRAWVEDAKKARVRFQ